MKVKRLIWAFLTFAMAGVIILSVSTCKKESKDDQNNQNPPVYTNGEGVIGQNGGTISISNTNSPLYGTQLNIPSGALSNNVSIKMSDGTGTEIPGVEGDIIIKFEPNGLVFNKEVDLILPYNNVSDPDSIQVYCYNADSIEVTQIEPEAIDKSAKKITCKIEHFSYYTATDKGVKMKIEMLNVNDDFIAMRCKLSGKATSLGLKSIPTYASSTQNKNVFDALLYDEDFDKSNFEVKLHDKDLGLNIIPEAKMTLYVERPLVYQSNYQAVVWRKYDGFFDDEKISTVENLATEIKGPIDTWFSGEPLLFNFSEYSEKETVKYFVKIKWVLQNYESGLSGSNRTAKYVFSNKKAAKKKSEMSLFNQNNIYNENIDKKYLPGNLQKPTVTTSSYSNVTQTTAELGGNVTSSGGATVTERGICLSTSSNPTIQDKIQMGSGTGNFSQVITGLNPNIPYYYKAYAINSVGTAFGSLKQFTTAGSGNNNPVIVFITPIGVNSGKIQINYSHTDLDGDNNTFLVFFQTASTGTKQATLYSTSSGVINGSKITNVSPGNQSFVWDSDTDFPNNHTTGMKISMSWIKPSGETIPMAETGSFEVNNSTGNNPPTAVFNANPQSGPTSTVFNFDASGSYDNEDPSPVLQVRWDWENDDVWDTPYSTTKIATHQFSLANTYTVKMEVKNSGGLTDSETSQVTVTGGGTGGEPCPGIPTITDPRDGQVYPTVQIGSQCWLQKNMNYQTGNSWCYNNAITNCDTYGRLYDWQTALGVCPSGWHLPSDTEWTMLTDFLGGMSVAGGKMKETGYTHWNSPNTGATNESGFTALPGGHNYGSFSQLGVYAYFWSSSEYSSLRAWYRYLYCNYEYLYRTNGWYKTQGFSVRCIKD